MFDRLVTLHQRTHPWLLLAVTLPYGIRVLLPGPGWEIIVLSEPLIAVLLLSVFAAFGVARSRDRSVRWAPLDIAVLVYVAAHLPATLHAAHLEAAIKATAVQIAHIVVFYVVPRQGLLSPSLTYARMLRWYAFAMVPMMAYAWANHILAGLDRAGAHHTAFPFFMDHNAFAAALTFALAVFAGLTIHRYVERGISHAVIGYGTLTLSTLTTIIFTYSRGAWVGLVVASLFAGFVYRRTRIARIALFMALPVIGVMAVFIVQGGRHLVTASAHGADLVAVVRSIGNTKNDPSNVDRLARWREAARMCGQAPLTGVGPGNYQFALAERWEQRSLEHVPVIVAKERMTPAVELGEHLLIRNDALRSPSSTGTAHSEYLLAFSEMGMIGGLAFLSLALIPVYTAAKSKRNLRGPWLAIALFSVVAYLVHGVFNNFLDEARIAFPFWISLAALAERSDQSEE